jgi:hypothetical protein
MFKKLELFKELLQNRQKEHTPYELCFEILEKLQIQPGKKVLIVSALEFIPVLIDYFGIDKKDIFFLDEGRRDGTMKTVKKWVLLTELDFTRDQVLTIEGAQNMKFDYIVGNPPYQEKKAGNKKANSTLWQQIILSVAELIQWGCVLESMEMAKEFEPYPAFYGSRWETGEQFDSYIKESVSDLTDWEWLKGEVMKWGVFCSQRFWLCPHLRLPRMGELQRHRNRGHP